VPVHDDRQLFELLLLEGAQVGLTWETIPLRPVGYRKAFNFSKSSARRTMEAQRTDLTSAF